MNEKKVKALELLLQGDSIVSIADEINVHRVTIYKWLNNDIEFKKAKEKAENKLIDGLYIAALSELEELLYNGSNYEKISAATQILKLKKSNDVNVKIEQPKTLEDLLNMTKNY